MFPIERVLVPRTAPDLPVTLAVQTVPLKQGLPETVPLDASASLVVVVPHGLAAQWLDVDPASIVSASDPETVPATDDPTAPVAGVVRPVAQLLVLVNRSLAGAVPLAAGYHARVVPPAGAGVELVVLGWTIAAGSMRGAGDHGSMLRLAWRRLGAGADAFQTPPLDPRVAQRLRRRFRLDSELGPEPRRVKLVRAL